MDHRYQHRRPGAGPATSLVDQIAMAASRGSHPSSPPKVWFPTTGLGGMPQTIPGAKGAGVAGDVADAGAAAAEASAGEKLGAFLQSLGESAANGKIVEQLAKTVRWPRGGWGSLNRSAFATLGSEILGMDPYSPQEAPRRSSYEPPPPPVGWSQGDIDRLYTLEWRREQQEKKLGRPLSDAAFNSSLMLSPEREQAEVDYWVAMSKRLNLMVQAAADDAQLRGIADPYSLPEIMKLVAHRDRAGVKVQESAKALDRMIAAQAAAVRQGEQERNRGAGRDR